MIWNLFKYGVLAVGIPAGAVYFSCAASDEYLPQTEAALAAAGRVWDACRAGAEANPFAAVSTAITVGAILMTVIVLRRQGRSLRESIAASVLRVQPSPWPNGVPQGPGIPAAEVFEPMLADCSPDSGGAVARAKAKTLAIQLSGDRVDAINNARKAGETVKTAEREMWRTKDAHALLTDQTEKARLAMVSADELFHTLQADHAKQTALVAEIDEALAKLAARC